MPFAHYDLPDVDNNKSDEPSYQEPDHWTIVSALDRVLTLAEDSHLSDEFWQAAQHPLEFLRQALGLTNVQIVILAILIESEQGATWRDISEYLSCSRLSVMVYAEEIDELVTKRWIVKRAINELGRRCMGFSLCPGVVTALQDNKCFVPEKIDGLTEQQFVDKLEKHVNRNLNSHDIRFQDDELWMLQLVKANPQLPLCQAVLKYHEDIHVQSLLLMAVYDYAQWADSPDEGMTIGFLDGLYPDDCECDFLRCNLRSGDHILQTDGILEYRCDDGVVNNEGFKLTRETKQSLLANYVPSRTKCQRKRAFDSRYLKRHQSIKPKDLFFNTADQHHIDRLASLLSQEHLPSIQQRLMEQGMRKGFACLFYGAPGTGKTETVLQIARQTGRDLMQIDISTLRDKFVGESEKNIKQVFSRYRELCRASDVMPILFFNEADAIINKRTENVQHSVDKMDNAMQNIILQEIEDLEGILIATTNLTSNLDKAFERRFLYKVEFHKPDTDVKTLIWRSMLKDLSSDDARQLATRFDFSGGQIENVARKRTVDYILSGKAATLTELEDYCQAELINDKSHRTVGFKL